MVKKVEIKVIVSNEEKAERQKNLAKLKLDYNHAIEESPLAVGVLVPKEDREKSKKMIEDFALNILRAKRKKFILSEMTEKDMQEADLSNEEKVFLEKLLTSINYNNYVGTFKNIIIEGIKYPQREVRHMVRDFCHHEFQRKNSPIIGFDLWIDLLSREYVSDTGFQFLFDHYAVFKKNGGSRVLHSFIVKVKDRNHSEESEVLYKAVCDLYRH